MGGKSRKVKDYKQVCLDIKLHEWLSNHCKITGRDIKFILDSLVRKYKKEKERRTKEVIFYGKQ